MTEKKNTPRYQARCLLLQSLYAWQVHPQVGMNIEPYLLLQQEQPVPVDLEYYRTALQSIISSTAELDAQLTPFVSRSLKSMTPIEHAILWIGTYELMSRIDIPYKVCLNEAIELAKDFGAVDSHKFVNGVLDKVRKKVRED